MDIPIWSYVYIYIYEPQPLFSLGLGQNGIFDLGQNPGVGRSIIVNHSSKLGYPNPKDLYLSLLKKNYKCIFPFSK